MNKILHWTKVNHPFRGERGATLAFTLMILVILVLIGFAALMTSSLDLKISGNEQVQKQAFYRAEAGLNYTQVSVDYGTINAGSPTKTVAYKLDDGTTAADVTVNFPPTVPVSIQNPTVPPPNALSSLQRYSAYHYTLTSTGKMDTQAQSLVELRGYVLGYVPE
jgi:Tfp pilus assembly protein PilX